MVRRLRGTPVSRISDDAVKAKTGKTWEEWFKILTKAGARMMDYREAVLLLRREHGLTAWWSRMVMVTYEEHHGIRQMHQKGAGYTAERSKTLTAPLAVVWAAWRDQATRDRWLPGARFEVAKSTPQKLLHLRWFDDTKVAIAFYVKGSKTEVVVSHEKLTESADVARLQNYWSHALDRLKHTVEV